MGLTSNSKGMRFANRWMLMPCFNSRPPTLTAASTMKAWPSRTLTSPVCKASQNGFESADFIDICFFYEEAVRNRMGKGWIDPEIHLLRSTARRVYIFKAHGIKLDYDLISHKKVEAKLLCKPSEMILMHTCAKWHIFELLNDTVSTATFTFQFGGICVDKICGLYHQESCSWWVGTKIMS